MRATNVDSCTSRRSTREEGASMHITKTPGPSLCLCHVWAKSCLGEIVSLLIMIVAFGSITTHNSPLSLIINQSDGSDDALAIISNQVVSSS